MADDNLLMCYNKGCGQKFSSSDNKSDACQHHPGVPVFHDALKGWSCCKKRSTDFTEFLNIPGCTKGEHSNIKPAEPEKPKPAPVEEVITRTPAPQVIREANLSERPSPDEPLQSLRVVVGSSLRQALEKRMNELSLTAADSAKESTEGEVSVGTACKNSACKKCYEGSHSNTEDCIYHPGVPIFHEGMKYWSCCCRKTSEFENFLNQEGCETGKHLWFKKEDPQKKAACRFDWHQTPGAVTVSVFSKVANPYKTTIKANRVSLKLSITFDGDKSVFEKDFILKGVIDPDKSKVSMLGTKVEVVLKKAEPGAWAALELTNS